MPALCRLRQLSQGEIAGQAGNDGVKEALNNPKLRHWGLDPQSKHHCISMASGLLRYARNDELLIIQSLLKRSAMAKLTLRRSGMPPISLGIYSAI